MMKKEKFIKLILVILGTIFVGLGVIGIFLPILPTTPFLLLAAACYVRSSEKLYHWLLTNPWFGSYIRNYRQGKGIPMKMKAYTISLLWITITASALFAVPDSLIWVKVLLFLIATAVTLHLVKIKTYRGKSTNKAISLSYIVVHIFFTVAVVASFFAFKLLAFE